MLDRSASLMGEKQEALQAPVVEETEARWTRVQPKRLAQEAVALEPTESLVVHQPFMEAVAAAAAVQPVVLQEVQVCGEVEEEVEVRGTLLVQEARQFSEVPEVQERQRRVALVKYPEGVVVVVEQRR